MQKLKNMLKNTVGLVTKNYHLDSMNLYDLRIIRYDLIEIAFLKDLLHMMNFKEMKGNISNL